MAIQSQVNGRSLEGGRTQVVYEAVEARQVMVHWRVLRPIEVRLQTPNPVWWFCCRPNTRWSTFKDSDPDRWIPPGIYSDEGQKKLQSSGCRRSLFRAVSKDWSAEPSQIQQWIWIYCLGLPQRLEKFGVKNLFIEPVSHWEKGFNSLVSCDTSLWLPGILSWIAPQVSHSSPLLVCLDS